MIWSLSGFLPGIHQQDPTFPRCLTRWSLTHHIPFIKRILSWKNHLKPSVRYPSARPNISHALTNPSSFCYYLPSFYTHQNNPTIKHFRNSLLKPSANIEESVPISVQEQEGGGRWSGCENSNQKQPTSLQLLKIFWKLPVFSCLARKIPLKDKTISMQQKIQYFLFLQDDERGSNTLIDADEKNSKILSWWFLWSYPSYHWILVRGMPWKKIRLVFKKTDCKKEKKLILTKFVGCLQTWSLLTVSGR